MMNIRFKLAAIAGLEALSSDINPEELQTHTTDGELSADDAVIENQINYEVSEANSDVNESAKLAENFIEKEEKQEQALNDLEEAVAGFEGLFEGEFSQVAYERLMRHTERCAQRAGVELPIKLAGMESMTPASIYLDTRNGLEGFMDSVKAKAGDIKKFIVDLYRFIIDLIKSQFSAAKKQSDEIANLIKQAKNKKGPLNEKITLGKWNGLLNVNDLGLPTENAYTNMLAAVESVNELNVRPFVLGSLDEAKTQLRNFANAVGHLKGDVHTTDLDGVKCNEIKLELGGVRVLISTPAANTSIPDERGLTSILHMISTSKKVISSGANVGDSTPAYYKNAETVVKVLEDMKRVSDKLSEVYQKQVRAIERERDLVISGIGIETSGEANYRSLIRNLVDAKRKISKETNSALRSVMGAHLSCIRSHL